MRRVVNFKFKPKDGRPIESGKLVLISHGHLMIETWGGENVYTIQYMPMQNGQIDFTWTGHTCNNPAEIRVLTGNIFPGRNILKGKGVRPEIIPTERTAHPFTEGSEALNLNACDRLAKLVCDGFMDEKSVKAMSHRIHKYLFMEDWGPRNSLQRPDP